jgi:Arc/MetJ-type ribon-helix-helix transcriptional regulator
MTAYHELMTRAKDKRPKRVSEPVQVYLDYSQRARLEQLANQLQTSMSDVVRRGIEALEEQLSDPGQHPSLRIVGIAELKSEQDIGYDVAREHDRFLAEAETAAWKPAKAKKRAGRNLR